MFTPKNIQGALEELYDLCDPDYMVDMLVNYSEEFGCHCHYHERQRAAASDALYVPHG